MINLPIQYLRGLASILVVFAHFKILPIFEMFNGAIGGKLVGAGGGGFLMFMANDRTQLREVMASAGLEEVRFKFDFEGTKVVMSS